MHPKYITSPTLLSKQNEKLPTWGWKPKHRLTDVSLWHSKALRWFLHSLRVHLWWRERQEDNTREQRFSLSSDRRMDRLILTGKSLGPTAPIKQQRAKNTLKRKKNHMKHKSRCIRVKRRAYLKASATKYVPRRPAPSSFQPTSQPTADPACLSSSRQQHTFH